MRQKKEGSKKDNKSILENYQLVEDNQYSCGIVRPFEFFWGGSGQIFILNFSGTFSREQHKTIFSGVRITEMVFMFLSWDFIIKN